MLYGHIWCREMKLNKKFLYLTKFACQFDRYRFAWMPFGVATGGKDCNIHRPTKCIWYNQWHSNCWVWCWWHRSWQNPQTSNAILPSKNVKLNKCTVSIDAHYNQYVASKWHTTHISTNNIHGHTSIVVPPVLIIIACIFTFGHM